jgi:16S rRNA (uracil1498-N3)-methyltransferase
VNPLPKHFFDAAAVSDKTVALGGDAAFHLLHVLRLKPGARITLCDGKGTDYSAVMREADAGKGTCVFHLSEPIPCGTEPPVGVTLYQALPKGDKMEWIIQKSVELGVVKIVPVYTSRTVTRDAGKKTARYQRIAESAAGQSMRGVVPEVTPPVAFMEAVNDIDPQVRRLAALSPSEAVGPALPALHTLLLSNDFNFGRIDQNLFGIPPTPLSLWIGPEGGFAPDEAAALIASGAEPFTLGPRVLRTETAALAALAQIICLTE